MVETTLFPAARELLLLGLIISNKRLDYSTHAKEHQSPVPLHLIHTCPTLLPDEDFALVSTALCRHSVVKILAR
jgi:hypothetical protein